MPNIFSSHYNNGGCESREKMVSISIITEGYKSYVVDEAYRERINKFWCYIKEYPIVEKLYYELWFKGIFRGDIFFYIFLWVCYFLTF